MLRSTLMRQAMHNAKSLSLVVLLAATSCGKATQPKPQCKVQQEEYSAVYIPVDQGMPAGCTPDDLKAGEVLFLQYYRTEVNGVPKLAIEPASFADAIAVGEEHQVDVKPEPEYSIGKFTDIYPDDKDVCTAPKLDDSSLTVAEVVADPNAMPPVEHVPAVDLNYKWTNVKVLTKPLSNAIHFGADLERKSGTCTMKYKVSASYPVIFCGDTMKPVLDEMGKPTGEEEPDFDNSKPVQEVCTFEHEEGSGLDPKLAYACNEHTLLCVPAHAFPSYTK
jgi:hypothetical protein